MKKQLYLFSTLLTFGFSAAFGAAIPDTSLMATGKWTKIRVKADAVYQMTYDELAELGYDNPEKVKVYGYTPTLLLTHSTDKIPGDLTPIHTVNVPSQKKIFFYLADNYNSSPEIWRTSGLASSYVNDHLLHAHSEGATYFLSDVETAAATTKKQSAPSKYAPETSFTSHKAVYYHENDELLMGRGGAWYIENPTVTTSNGITHEFTVSHLAASSASLFYAAALAPSNTNKDNFMKAEFSEGITAEPSIGFTPQILGDKYEYNPSLRYQELSLPLTVEPTTHSITFKINDGGLQKKACALDYFALIYERSNDLSVRPQTMMYYTNWTSGDKKVFELSGINAEDWMVWNVTDPMSIKIVQLTQNGDKFYGSLSTATKQKPNEVIAFNTADEQPSPEIIGSVDNQNLHAMSVPDMLIVTSTPLLGSAEYVASFHRRLQGLEVAVVDQQKIFNEYGSGNTSPEAVRRFIGHLSSREPEKLKGVLMLGPGTTDNRGRVGGNNTYVVTAQCEDYTQANNVTTNYCADVFFVTSGDPYTVAPWNGRHSSLQIFANQSTIGIGRLPFDSQAKINDYYRKVETYLTQLPTSPSIGNALFASDFSTAFETRTHLGDSEEMIAALNPENVGNSLTITRCASNLLSNKDNTILKTIHQHTLARGVQLYSYFGHGSVSGISGSTATVDMLLDMKTAASSNYPGKAPFMFLASCDVAAFDQYSQTLAGALVANPNGGAMTVISSGREVYPERNVALGCSFAKTFESSTNNMPIGQVWTSAVSQFMQENETSKLNIANTLDYNLIGDPMLPVYRSTHNIAIDPIEGNSLSTVAAKSITGSIKNLDGTTATDFNGTVLLTFYDPKRTLTNVINDNKTENPPYLRTVEIDQDVIGQVTAEVKNGVFEVITKAPVSSNSGDHRIQAYAYSTDATERGLGSISGIAFNSEAGQDVPEAAPISISGFNADIITGTTDHKFKVVLTASIDAPAGLANKTPVISPLRLWIDNSTMTDAGHLVHSNGHGSFTLEYATKQLDFGRHTATLHVLDAAGNWAEESINFMIDNTPSASISAAVADGEVNFEVASEVSSPTHRLVVERLNGDIALDETFTGSNHAVTLAAGAYRAYVQVRSGSAATATEKIQFVVD